jgi:hypothetical protein
MLMRHFMSIARQGPRLLCFGMIRGALLLLRVSFIPHVTSVAMAEVMAMKDGLNFANQFGCSRIEAESDSQETIKGCTGGDTWWSETCAIFVDCLDVTAGLHDVKFKHCPREANKVADELARFCFHSANSCNWVDEFPSFILQTLLDDVAIM